MDEAEYCARIGLMVQGKLVALDTPRALKQAWVPGEVVAIHTRDIQLVRRAIAEFKGVLAVEPFGSTVHVRFNAEQVARPELERALAKVLSVMPKVEPADVSLEDVFLAVVTREPSPTNAGAVQPVRANPDGEPLP
jgi:ABC-2 type transport system ATP-binding protein